jgi:hypothetical protein
MAKGKIPAFNTLKVPLSSDFINFTNMGTTISPDYQVEVQVTSTDRQTFKTYHDLKNYCEFLWNSGIHEQRSDAILLRLRQAIRLVELNGYELKDVVFYRPTHYGDDAELVLHALDGTILYPTRLDMCECRNLLKCPNGTDTTGFGAQSSEDCIVKKNEVLRRIPVTTPNSVQDNITAGILQLSQHEHEIESETLALGTFHLKAYDIAHYTVNLSSLPRNMTYGKDYQLSIYRNCKPCPTRYRCESETACSRPSKESQHSRLNLCLKKYRKEVCVHRNGTSIDIDLCTNGTFVDESLTYSEPDLEKCLSAPLFCEDKPWNFLTFRKLCRDEGPFDQNSLVYKCSLVDQWFQYKTWKEDICCSVKNEMGENHNCTKESCTLDELEDRILTDRFYPIFVKEFGFSPPEFEPKASFIMSKELQEESENRNPLSLFEEWNDALNASVSTHSPFSAEQPDHSSPWKQTDGCCKCKPHPLPEFFQSNAKNSGLSDNKHHNISFTVTALEDMQITTVIELLNGQFYGFFDNYFYQKDVFTSYTHRPSRFSRGSNGSQWLSVIRKDTFSTSNMDLPLNLPMRQVVPAGQQGHRSMENSILVDRPCTSFNKTIQSVEALTSYNDDGRVRRRDECVPDSYSTVYHSEDWWMRDTTPAAPGIDSKFSAIALPYFPFFSSCDGFDSHLSLSKLLEEHDNCTVFRHNETNQVSQFAITSDNFPKGDYCMATFPPLSALDPLKEGAALHCIFEEQVDSASDRNRWYESNPEDTLFYITQDAVPSDMFVAKYSTINNNLLTSRGWGRADEVVDGQHVIPVKVDKHYGGMKNAIPREISLELQYFQVDRSTKRLVRATLYYSNLCTTLKPEYFGGDAEMLREMKELDILPCGNDINGKLKSQAYELRISFYPLDWFNLLNGFQFYGFVYFVYFTLAGGTTIAIGYIIWIINKASTKLRHPPKFHGIQLFKLLAEPSLVGTSLAFMAFTCCSFFVSIAINPNSAFIQEISGNWYASSSPDDEIMKNIRHGRTGAIILSLSVYATIVSASFVIQQRDDVKVNEDEEDFITDADTNTAPQSESWTPTKWKRAHFVLCCFGLELCLLCLWEISYSAGFAANLREITIISKLVFVIFEIAITKLLKEKLLCVPFMVAIGITEIISTIGAADFVDFTVIFFLQIASTVFHRLYIDPCVKSFESIWPRWKFILIKKLTPRFRMTVQQKRNEEKKWRKINEAIELRSEGVEPLIDAITLSTINITTRILAPVFFILLSLFYSESHVAENYSISARELSYYVLFAFCMIPWTLGVDVMIFNTQELVHGWRLYDYLAYQRHRFASRDCRWSLNIPYYDESILDPLQTIDLMSFSSQYYFVAALLSGSITTTLFGATILLRSKHYSILSDPALPLIIAAVTVLVRAFKHIIVYLSSIKIKYLDWEGIWGSIQIEGTLDDMIAAKLQIGQGRQVDLAKERMELEALNNEKFRQRFLERNRPWILRHLVELLTENNKSLSQAEKIKLIDYTKGVFSELVSMGHGDRRVGDRSDISSDDDEDEFDDVRRRWDSSTVIGTSRDIVKLWLDKARKRRMYALSIRDIMQSQQEHLCLNCARGKSSCERISVCLCTDGRYNPAALDMLISHFEEEFPLSGNDTILWNSYVRQNAEIKTLCNICKAQTNKTWNNAEEKRVTRPGDISSDDDNDESNSFEPMVIDKLSSNGQLLTKWLLAARAKMGGRFPRPNAELFCTEYVQKMKRIQAKTPLKTVKNKPDRATKSSSKEWGPIKVKQASKVIVSRWLSTARENNRDRDDTRGIVLRSELDTCLIQIEPIDDGHFSELRLEGFNLQAEGSMLSSEADISMDEGARSIKAIEDAKNAAIHDLECKITRKRKEFDEKINQHNEVQHPSSLSTRSSELKVTIDRLSQGAEQEKQRLESSVALEKRQIEDARKNIMKEEENKMNVEIKLIERDMITTMNIAKQDIEFVRKQKRKQVDEKEKDWRGRTVVWSEIVQRKITFRSQKI